MGRRLVRRSLLLPALLRSAMLLPASLPMIAGASQTDLQPGDNCAQRIRVIDDQADVDVREVNQEIARLRLELAAASSAANTSHESAIQTELAAAQARRKETLRDHHSVLNDVRAECDVLRDAARQATRDAPSSATEP